MSWKRGYHGVMRRRIRSRTGLIRTRYLACNSGLKTEITKDSAGSTTTDQPSLPAADMTRHDMTSRGVLVRTTVDCGFRLAAPARGGVRHRVESCVPRGGRRGKRFLW